MFGEERVERGNSKGVYSGLVVEVVIFLESRVKREL